MKIVTDTISTSQYDPGDTIVIFEKVYIESFRFEYQLNYKGTYIYYNYLTKKNGGDYKNNKISLHNHERFNKLVKAIEAYDLFVSFMADVERLEYKLRRGSEWS